MLKDGTLDLESIRKWKEHEQKIKEVEERLKTVDEKLKVIEEEKKSLLESLKNLRKYMYKYPDAAVNEHIFWSNESGTAVAKIVDDEYLSPYAFLVTNKDETDHKYISSSLGVLYGYPVPITEKKFNELHDKLSNKSGVG